MFWKSPSWRGADVASVSAIVCLCFVVLPFLPIFLDILHPINFVYFYLNLFKVNSTSLINIIVILRRHLHELLILTPYQTSRSLQKQLTFCSTTTHFPAKGWLRNKPRNSILMMYLTQIWVVLLIGWSKFLTNIGSSTQIWVGDFAIIPWTSFCGETSGGIAKCMLTVFSD